MTGFAALPSWMIFVLIMVAVGPVMRMLFGGRYISRGRKRVIVERLPDEDSRDVARLDAALAERDLVIEDLQRRLSELESRLDFTERLLARPADSAGSNLPA